MCRASEYRLDNDGTGRSAVGNGAGRGEEAEAEAEEEERKSQGWKTDPALGPMYGTDVT